MGIIRVYSFDFLLHTGLAPLMQRAYQTALIQNYMAKSEVTGMSVGWFFNSGNKFSFCFDSVVQINGESEKSIAFCKRRIETLSRLLKRVCIVVIKGCGF